MSTISICNRALDLLGADPILSLDDSSKSGRLCARNFAAARDAVLRAYPWNGAMKRARLAALVETPAWGYAAQYQLPSDCLRILRLDDMGETPWRIEGRRILTDAGAPLNVLYIARTDDIDDPLLADAIAARLATDIGYAITGNASGQQAAWQLYTAKLAEARAIDAQEGTPDAFTADQWLESRL